MVEIDVFDTDRIYRLGRPVETAGRLGGGGGRLRDATARTANRVKRNRVYDTVQYLPPPRPPPPAPQASVGGFRVPSRKSVLASVSRIPARTIIVFQPLETF